jgi:hypothetical protein
MKPYQGKLKSTRANLKREDLPPHPAAVTPLLVPNTRRREEKGRTKPTDPADSNQSILNDPRPYTFPKLCR